MGTAEHIIMYDNAWSRGTLGDYEAKGIAPGVISEPEIHHEKIHSGDLVILACDGVWDVLSSQEAVDVVREALGQKSTELEKRFPSNPILRTGNFGQHPLDNFTEEAGDDYLKLVVRVLRDTAYWRGSTDNISVGLLRFK